MKADCVIETPTAEADLEAYVAVAAEAFSFSPERAGQWLDMAGRENVRVVRRAGEIAGGLVHIPMAQYFGGVAVPMAGIAAVAIAPQHRGGGAARQLMAATVRELHSRGVALSTLYPASWQLYRLAGYEHAGVTQSMSLRLADIRVRERSLPVRPATEGDEEAIRALYADYAPQQPGALVRGKYIWDRIHTERGVQTRGYVVEDGSGLRGYMFYRRLSDVGRHEVLRLCDFVTTDVTATRALLTHLAAERAQCRQVQWRTGMTDPLYLVLDLGEFSTDDGPNVELWMTRITHIESALTTRRYPVGLGAELHLRVSDEVVAAQAGDWVLRVADGRGVVERGGRGTLALDVRALASLYTGFHSPAELAAAGLLSGPPADQALAAAIFAGPQPWLRDMF